MAPMESFGRCRTVMKMEDNKYNVSVAAKELVDNLPTFENDSESAPSQAGSQIEKIGSKKSSKCR